MHLNQSPELSRFGINYGYPDSANLANDRLAKKGKTGELVIKLTTCFDNQIDRSLGIANSIRRHNKKLPPSRSKSNT